MPWVRILLPLPNRERIGLEVVPAGSHKPTHTGSIPVSATKLLSCSSMAERAADNRQTRVRFPTGRPVKTGCSSVWSELPLWKRKVGGSNPLTPTNRGPRAMTVVVRRMGLQRRNLLIGVFSVSESDKAGTSNLGS